MSGERYRVGPWPGLTARGAAVLLGCAALLAMGQLVWDRPSQPLPGMPMLAVASLLPLALATRIVRIPGAAAAVCGAYLLPRSVVSMFDPGLPPPPLLLVPALAFDVCAWLTAADVSSLVHLWPRRKQAWRRSRRPNRRVNPSLGGALFAAGVFGMVLGLVEPPLAVLLGADPGTWALENVWPAVCLGAAVCAPIGLIARGTAR